MNGTEQNRKHIVTNSQGYPMHYRGHIVGEDQFFIKFNDRKLGIIRLSKSSIQIIEPLGGDRYE